MRLPVDDHVVIERDVGKVAIVDGDNPRNTAVLLAPSGETEDGRLTIDNNTAERTLRHQAIGRKNWLFLGSEQAGPRAAVLYTILAGAKRHRIEPWAYVRDLLLRSHAEEQQRIREQLAQLLEEIGVGGLGVVYRAWEPEKDRQVAVKVLAPAYADDELRTRFERERKAQGADLVKITSTGGVLTDRATGTGQQMEMDELREVVLAAERMGRKVASHAHEEDGIIAALQAGVASIEHGTYTGPEAIKLFKETGAYLVPTLLAGKTVGTMAVESDFMSDAIREKAIRVGRDMAGNFAKAHAAGVNVAYGTDSGVSPHGTNAEEALLMVEAGMSEMEVLVAATINAADLIDMSDSIGTIEAGKFAAEIVPVTVKKGRKEITVETDDDLVETVTAGMPMLAIIAIDWKSL